MKKVLILSTDNDFATDLKEQIELNISDYNVSLEHDTNTIFDIVVINEDDAKIKSFKNTPIVFLTSNTKDHSDCKTIRKPMILASFLDEIQAIIHEFENSSDGILKFNKYELRPSLKEIYNLRNKNTIKLTEKEVAVIKYLFKSKGKIVSKNDLLQNVWGYNPNITTHTIETHIYRLRQKVEEGDASAQLIATEEGGYKLVV